MSLYFINGSIMRNNLARMMHNELRLIDGSWGMRIKSFAKRIDVSHELNKIVKMLLHVH